MCMCTYNQMHVETYVGGEGLDKHVEEGSITEACVCTPT